MQGKITLVRFFMSSTLSVLGNSVAAVVLPLVLLARTGDALAAGTLALVCAIPMFAMGLLGGALLDRFNRRIISIISDIVSATSIALIPVVDMVWGLNFGWFIALGLLGAIGDIPGMTARETLLPEIAQRDGADLQRITGIEQVVESLATIVGPAVAAMLIGFGGEVSTLWITAALSCLAALVTFTLPRDVGMVATKDTVCEETEKASTGLVRASLVALTDGARILFGKDKILRAATLLAFGITMILGSYQGIVLPVFFTQNHQPELLGYVLSAMSAGLLAGTLGYSVIAGRVRKRTWYVTSLVGMLFGCIVMGLLPSFPVMVAGAALLGLAAGPASALLGFFAYDRIPESRRGSALGTQNALLLVAVPAAEFVTSAAVDASGTEMTAIALAVCWLAVSAWAMLAPGMRRLDEETTQQCENTQVC